MATLKQIKKELEKERAASCWGRGVLEYANELLDDLYYIEESEELTSQGIEAVLLNGAIDWSSYSWGGCSLIYDSDICERLATPSEQKKKNSGELRPNSGEEWLDCQARALYQASRKIKGIIARLDKEGAR